ncbi:MAG: protein kinase, partial [candidate division WOR-3 bacterium]
AQLDHPNVCTIHEIEEAEGNIFIAMAYCEGQSLRKRIESGTVSLSETLDIAIQVAEGLLAAHGNGIVHRDIKPGNVMLTADGLVKITDFGLARLTGITKTTQRGETRGTIHYMSPEHVRGETVDHSTDIWSLGVMLYELITGELPFKSEYDAAILYSIVNEDPVPAIELNNTIPPELDLIISTALNKDINKRYSSIKIMLEDLQKLQWRLLTHSKRPPEDTSVSTTVSVRNRFAFLAIFLAIAAVLIAVLTRTHRYSPGITPMSIAVLEFDDHSQDSTLAVILAELLRTDLFQNPYTKILSRDRMFELQRSGGIKELTLSSGFDICRREQIESIIHPRIIKIGDTYRIEALVYDVNSTTPLFAKRATGQGKDQLIGLIEQLSREIVTELKLLPQRASDRLPWSAQSTTKSIDAYELYMTGYKLYEGNDPLKPIPFLEQAIATDSSFIDAYIALAILYNYIGDTRALACAKSAKEIAKANNNTLAFFEAVIAESRICRNWNQAIAYMRQYLELWPNDIDMRINLGYILSRRMKEFEKSIIELEHVLELDHMNLSGRIGPTLNSLGHAYFFDGQFDRAIECFERYRTHLPNRPDPLHSLGDVYRIRGEYERAESYFSEAILLSPAYYESYEELGLTYLATGQWRKAISEFKRYVQYAPLMKRPWGYVLIAKMHLLQNDFQSAKDALDEALTINP